MIEPSTPTRDCPNPEKWTAICSDTCENEVLDFLRVLVHTIKPSYIVETGTCFGWSARAMALMMWEGKIDTCDPENKLTDTLPRNVRYHQCKSLDFIPSGNIDLLFLDSDLNVRVREYFHFKPYLSARAVIVLHDVGDTHSEFKTQVLSQLQNELDMVLLPTPRGLLIGRPKQV